MADTFELYGRIDGKIVFTYGPKKFTADWGGVFTAFEIANYLTKVPKVTMGTSEVPFRRIGTIIEKTNLKMWLERLNLTLWSLKLDSLLINGTDERSFWPDKILPTQQVTFLDHACAPLEPVTEALIRMGLNKWGIVQELTNALSEFEGKATGGRRSATVTVKF
jgi:hypothetical protein